MDAAGSDQQLGVQVRAGLHTGECEVADGKSRKDDGSMAQCSGVTPER